MATDERIGKRIVRNHSFTGTHWSCEVREGKECKVDLTSLMEMKGESNTFLYFGSVVVESRYMRYCERRCTEADEGLHNAVKPLF